METTYTAIPNAGDQMPTPVERKVKVMPERQILIESEILNELNCKCLTRLVHLYNQFYRFGFLFAYIILVLLTLLVAPVLGLLGGLLDWATMLVRIVIRPVGKLVADLLGYGTTASLYNAKLERELNV